MPITYKDYQDKLHIVNSNLVGRKDRRKINVPNNGQGSFHPAAKNDWGTVDRFRGCLGSYLAIYQSAAYENYNIDAKLLINYSTYVKDLKNGGSTKLGANDANIGRLKEQLVNIVIDYEWLSARTDKTLQSPNTRDTALTDRISIMPNAGNWDAWQNKPPQSENWLGPTPVAGNAHDNWKLFTGAEAFQPFHGGNPNYLGLVHGISSDHQVSFDGDLLDHTAVFYGPPKDLETREKSGLLFDPSPTYNFYVQAGVSYEEVIADGWVPDFLLPNVYYLQHELMNTSSTLLAPYHLDALTLAQNIDYFEVTDAQSVTEANTRSYYDMYINGLKALSFDQPELERTTEVLEKSNRNFAILHSDLKALDKNAVHLSTVPFYNTIAIGAYQDQVTGWKDNRSILNALWDDKETRDFIDLLQMTAISRLNTHSDAAVTGSFAITSRRAEASSRPNNDTGGYWPAYNTETAGDITVLFDLGDFAHFLVDEHGGSNAVHYYNQLNDQKTWDSPVKRIRDYSRENLDANPQSAITAIDRLFESSPNGDLANVRGVTRSMKEVFDNVPCHTETLLYVIEKRKAFLHSGGNTTVGPVVQTFYISPRLHSSLPAYFYDTQVKYNQQYRYDVKKVVLVFGNAYSYKNRFDGVSPATGVSTTEQHIWNETNVKAIVVPHIIGGLDAAPIIDKPPREPEISFYAYKGVNDKLLILLNAATGRTVQSPIEILEGDKQYFEEEYYSQNRTSLTFDEIKAQDKKITFKSDDPVDRYQLFKLSTAPTSYKSFVNALLPEVDPDFGVGGTIIDNIRPNTKYYYCARSIDVHENVSNPTYIFEIEMVDNNGQIFLKQNVFSFEKVGENFVKSGRRFIYIEPALQQTVVDQTGYGSTLGNPSLTTAPGTGILGADGVADQVWGKGFKVRLTSKQTGRKLDLNINFTNTGMVKPSE
jgi:hypothetical protein